MSSFLINKDEFVKAAALCAAAQVGIGRPTEVQYAYLKEFLKFYRWSFISVKMQYCEDIPGSIFHSVTDEEIEGYKPLYEDYFKKGRSLKAKNPTELRTNLIDFLNSVLYQVEDMNYNTEMGCCFFKIVCAITPKPDNGWWGGIDI